MIRSALIALGLSAGALSALFSGASGATAARPQGMVRAAPIVEVCGGTPVEQTEVCSGAEVDASPTKQPPDDVKTAHVAAGDLPSTELAVQPAPAGVADDGTVVMTVAAMRVSRQCGPAPFHRNTVFQDTMDGSDPSADFCP